MEQLFENWRRYLTEDQLITEQQIIKYAQNSDIEHLWENNNFEKLDEGVKDWMRFGAQTLLDVIGVADPTGISDLMNAMWYAYRKCWIMAALSIISVLPVFGDALGKGTKLLMYLGKGAKYLLKVKKMINKNRRNVKKTFDKIKESDMLPSMLTDNSDEMFNSLDVFATSESTDHPDC